MSTYAVSSAAAMTARWLASVHFAVLAAQILFAMAFIGGHGNFFVLHTRFSLVVAAAAATQAAVFAFLRVVRRVSWLYFGYALLALFLVLLQQRIIVQLTTFQHVSLAMVYWGLSLAILIKVWTPAWNEAGSDANP